MMAAPVQRRARGIPPAPPVQADCEVLASVDTELALALWCCLHAVLLWSGTSPAARSNLFQPLSPNVRERFAHALRLAPELEAPLGTFAALQEAPEQGSESHLASACHQVYTWADRHGLYLTALHFAQAAAYVEPTNPTWAVDAAWICRRTGGELLLQRSEAWYRRAYALAVRKRSRHESLRALTGHGALKKDQGKYEEARSLYLRAARRATRTGRSRRAAVAYHYLFGLEAETGNVTQAVEYAGRALTLYPMRDARLPALVHDYAVLLIRHGCFRPAYRLLDAAVSRMDRPEELALVFSTAARAAGGCGRVERYEKARRATLELIALHPGFASSAHNNLAEGARSLCDWERAAQHAKQAAALAEAAGYAEIEADAHAILEAVGRREPGQPEERLDNDARIAALARRLAARVKRWRRRNPQVQS